MINEVEGLSALTLHDSHADLFDVLIARLFTLEGTGRGGKNDCCDRTGIYMIMEWKQPLPIIFRIQSVSPDGDVSTVLRLTKAGRQTQLSEWHWRNSPFLFHRCWKADIFVLQRSRCKNLHQIALWKLKKWAFLMKSLMLKGWFAQVWAVSRREYKLQI